MPKLTVPVPEDGCINIMNPVCPILSAGIVGLAKSLLPLDKVTKKLLCVATFKVNPLDVSVFAFCATAKFKAPSFIFRESTVTPCPLCCSAIALTVSVLIYNTPLYYSYIIHPSVLFA